jgi:hypothetical protein
MFNERIDIIDSTFNGEQLWVESMLKLGQVVPWNNSDQLYVKLPTTVKDPREVTSRA